MGRLLVHDRILGRPTAVDRTQELEGAHGSESRASVVVAMGRNEERGKEAGQLELPEMSVLEELSFVNQKSGDT